MLEEHLFALSFLAVGVFLGRLWVSAEDSFGAPKTEIKRDGKLHGDEEAEELVRNRLLVGRQLPRENLSKVPQRGQS